PFHRIYHTRPHTKSPKHPTKLPRGKVRTPSSTDCDSNRQRAPQERTPKGLTRPKAVVINPPPPPLPQNLPHSPPLDISKESATRSEERRAQNEFNRWREQSPTSDARAKPEG